MTALATLSTALATRFGMGGGDPEVLDILRSTVFKTRDAVPSDAQMTALLIVANQYGLNPWTKEIYAYPDKQNGIVPVVGVDGWSRIINEHPQLDGIEFTYSEATVEHKGKTAHVWIECAIYRKDRSRPTVVREYFAEVVRTLNYSTPWDSHPCRMHRHKTLIQCARIAFGFAGIYDDDEAVRIVEAGTINPDTGEIAPPATPQRKSRAPADVTDATVVGETVQSPPPPVKTNGSGNGSISPGQVAHIKGKAKAAGLDDPALLAMVKRHGAASLESMTGEQFDAVRAELVGML